MATRISVLWMTGVPQLPDGTADYDNAAWASIDFFGDDQIDTARAFAQRIANGNFWGQSWLQIERGKASGRSWLWERDYDADETFHRQAP